jgi:transposase
MPNPYPTELRERAVQAYENGEGTYVEIAERFAIAVPTLQRWVARSRATGAVEPLPKRGGNFSRVNVSLLVEIVTAHPDWTSDELTAEYNRRASRTARAHRSSIFRALRREGYVSKKTAEAGRAGPVRGPREPVGVSLLADARRSRQTGIR